MVLGPFSNFLGVDWKALFWSVGVQGVCGLEALRCDITALDVEVKKVKWLGFLLFDILLGPSIS